MDAVDRESPEFQQAAGWLRAAKHVVVFSGAGASAESGIATFRDVGGFWQEFPPDTFATWSGLMRTATVRPAQLARFLLAVLGPVARAMPNAGHLAVAEIERHINVTVITQNIDGLHTEAGSTTVHQIHGTLFEVATVAGRFIRIVSRPEMLRVVASLERAAASRLVLPRLLAAVRPIFGVGVHGAYRPRVVLFGDAMAEPDWRLSGDAVQQCDCLITVGTSEEVFPAALLPQAAATAGAKVIRIDPNPGYSDVWLPELSATALPALVESAFGKADGPS